MGNKLISILKTEGDEMLAAFKKASIQGEGTPQEIADFRENHFNKFIAKYFPYPHRVAKGIIIDSFGGKSNSIDSIIINPNHPYTIDSSGKFSLILADGVDAAIEVKPDISKVSELKRGLDQMCSVKKLRRRRTPAFLSSNIPSQIIEFSKTIPSFIFSLRANQNPLDTGNNIISYYSKENIPIAEQVDFVVINNKGIISNYKYPELSKDRKKNVGLHYEEWRELTMVAFIVKLNESYPAIARLSEPILSYYTEGLRPYEFSKI